MYIFFNFCFRPNFFFPFARSSPSRTFGIIFLYLRYFRNTFDRESMTVSFRFHFFFSLIFRPGIEKSGLTSNDRTPDRRAVGFALSADTRVPRVGKRANFTFYSRATQRNNIDDGRTEHVAAALRNQSSVRFVFVCKFCRRRVCIHKRGFRVSTDPFVRHRRNS